MQLLDKDIKPLKIEILGDYWDSHIYKGKLFLWTMEGSILIIDWDSLVKSTAEDKNSELMSAIENAFTSGDELYSNKDVANILRYINYQEVFSNALSKLYNEKFIIAERRLKKFIIKTIDNPLKDLPTDLEIYYDTIYTILDNGLWKYYIDLGQNNITQNAQSKLWDCSLLNMKIRNGGRIALSGGDEGLFEYNLGQLNINAKDLTIVENHHNIYHLSKTHSTFNNWSFSSIYSSSDIENSYMAAFNWDKNANRINYKGTFSETDIFGENSNFYLSWGADDKLYKANKEGLEIVKFTQSRLNIEDKKAAFSEKKIIKFNQWKGRIISAGVTLYGTILELEDAIVILQSNDKLFTIEGPVTKWRVFPRSVRYENHLHVVLEDRISIYSFNHDYFIDQNKKYFGIKKSFNTSFKNRYY